MKRLVGLVGVVAFVAGVYFFIDWYYHVPEPASGLPSLGVMSGPDLSVPDAVPDEPVFEPVPLPPPEEEPPPVLEPVVEEEPEVVLEEDKPESPPPGVEAFEPPTPEPVLEPEPEPVMQVESVKAGPITRSILAETDPSRRADLLRRLMAEQPDSPDLIRAIEMETQRCREEEEKGLEWETLSFLFLRSSPGERRDRMQQRLDELTEFLIFSRRPGPHSVQHTIQPGDTLGKLAAKYNCPQKLIQKINGITNPNLIRIGDRLKVIVGTIEIHVRKKEFTLTVTLEGKFLRHHLVGIGGDDLTPVGEFKVKDKIDNPTWFDRGRVIPAGDPENILGTVWIGFEATEEVRGIGIHGTTEPETIGTEASAGCIRMHNKDVEDLVILIPRGTPVHIQ